ncbi:MAG: CehA/McbA family metallohydrolase, partial [Deltaproteobacteria bacterium]|nr:CehA/McbA family metallohydrolase [Deltaproteobacteria bacterium]
TDKSDGDSAPAAVAQWYFDHGYDFLVISDHNWLTDPVPVRAEVMVSDREFLMVPGEEITNLSWVHVNGIGIATRIPPSLLSAPSAAAAESIAAVRAQRGIPIVNHPNYGWGLGVRTLLETGGMTHLEVFNGSPATHSSGDGSHPSVEVLWDRVLSGGKRVFAVAVDDAHRFKTWGSEYANPGNGWIAVRAPELTQQALLDAIDQGNFYASTGVVLSEVELSRGRVGLKIAAVPFRDYSTEFIGQGGRTLQSADGVDVSYAVLGYEGYVRARVTDSSGAHAWTQPVFLP